MQISYNRLWKLLIDRNMRKNDLRLLAGLSPSTITKMGHNETVTTETLMKICVALDCTMDDIVEIEAKKRGETKPNVG